MNDEVTMMRTAPELQPADLTNAVSVAQAVLTPFLDRDWETLACDMTWSCRRTLDHVADSLTLYSAYFATRATGRIRPPRNGDPSASVPDLLRNLELTGAILAEVVRAAPPGVRAFHPAGISDATGFLAMGCEEILGHTWDIAQGLGVTFTPPEELAAKVVARIFPWAPTTGSASDAFLWAAGRIALPGYDRLDAQWSWHCAPLSEWDGTINRRKAPPAW